MSIPINNSHKLFYKCYRISKKNFSVYKKSKASSKRVFFKAIYQRFQRFFHNSSSHMVDHSERNNVVDYNYEPEGYFQQYAMQYYIDRIFLVVYAPAKLQGPQIFFLSQGMNNKLKMEKIVQKNRYSSAQKFQYSVVQQVLRTLCVVVAVIIIFAIIEKLKCHQPDGV